jgi:hypothetical protein
MRIYEVVEARLEPDHNFMAQVELLVDESLAEYHDFLEDNNDKDDIDELEEILNSNNVDELPIEFVTDHSNRRNPDEWISAAADWSEEEGKFITIYLHATNLEGRYGPKTFKNILMRMIGHETIHWGQYDKMGADVLNNYQSGHQKGVALKSKTGNERDWMRSYLRDPHELMAYGHDLAQEIVDNTDNPEETLRNPERFKDQLPVYQRFREIFPPNSKQIKQLLKYTADYFKR